MLNILRMVRLGVDAARWAAPHVQDWKRQRNFNELEAWRNLEAKNWGEADKHFSLALEEPRHSDAKRLEFLLGLAEAQRKQSKYAPAEATARKAVELATQTKNHPSRLDALDVIVTLHLEHDRAAEARQVAEEIVQLEHARPRPDHGRLVKHLRRLGDVCLHQKDYERAEEVFENSVKLAEQSFGSDHVETADSLAGLGRSLRLVGKHNDAQLFLRGALEIHRATRGQDSREVSEDLYQLAGSLEDSGSVESAMAEYEKALALRERQVGVNPEETAALKIHLGSLYLETGRSSAAREMLIHAMRVFEKSGDDRYLHALDVMARAEDHAGRGKEADRLREKAKLVVATRGTQRRSKTYELAETLSVATPAPMTTPPSLWREPSPVRPPANSAHPEPSDIRLFKPRTSAQPAAYSAELEQVFQSHSEQAYAHGQYRPTHPSADFPGSQKTTQAAQHLHHAPHHEHNDFSDFYRSVGTGHSRPAPIPVPLSGHPETVHFTQEQTANPPNHGSNHGSNHGLNTGLNLGLDGDGFSSLSPHLRAQPTVFSPPVPSPPQHAESSGHHTTYIAGSEPIGETSSYIVTPLPAGVQGTEPIQAAALLAALSQQARSNQPPAGPEPAVPEVVTTQVDVNPRPATQESIPPPTTVLPTLENRSARTLPLESSPSTVDLTPLSKGIGDTSLKPLEPSRPVEALRALADRQIPLEKPQPTKPPTSRNRFIREGNDRLLQGTNAPRYVLPPTQIAIAQPKPALEPLLKLAPGSHPKISPSVPSAPGRGAGDPVSLFPPVPVLHPAYSLSQELLAQPLVSPDVLEIVSAQDENTESQTAESSNAASILAPSSAGDAILPGLVAATGTPQIRAQATEIPAADILPSSENLAGRDVSPERSIALQPPALAPLVVLSAPQPVRGVRHFVAIEAANLPCATAGFLSPTLTRVASDPLSVEERSAAMPSFAHPVAIRVPSPIGLAFRDATPAPAPMPVSTRFSREWLARLHAPRRILKEHEFENAQRMMAEDAVPLLGTALTLRIPPQVSPPLHRMIVGPAALESNGQPFLAKSLVRLANFPHPAYATGEDNGLLGQLCLAPKLALPVSPAQPLKPSSHQPASADIGMPVVLPENSLAADAPDHSPTQGSPLPMPRITSGAWRDRRQARIAPNFDEDRLLLPTSNKSFSVAELSAGALNIEIEVNGRVAGSAHVPRLLPAFHQSANATPGIPIFLNQTPARLLPLGDVQTMAVSTRGSVHSPATFVLAPPGLADFTTQLARPAEVDPIIAPEVVVPAAARIPGHSDAPQVEPQGRTLYAVRNVEARAWLVRYRDTRVRFPRPNQHKLSTDDLELVCQDPGTAQAEPGQKPTTASSSTPFPQASMDERAPDERAPFPDGLPAFGAETHSLDLDDDLPTFD